MTEYAEYAKPRSRRGGGRVAIWCLLALSATAVCRADDSTSFARVEERTMIANLDGTAQKYVLMTPHGITPGQQVSLLIALHGHGSDRWQFVRDKRGECRGARDVAAAKKMLLVSPDYRATTSWMGPAAEADLLQLIRALKKRFKVRRVILCGGSMGGTGALTFTALHPKLIDGVVSLNGTANLVKYERFQDAIARSFGGTKQEKPKQYRKRSTEFFPDKFTMPFAATTGGKDKVVPADSVLRLIAQVRKHNPHVLGIHRSGGGHLTTYADTKRALEFVIAASDSRPTAAQAKAGWRKHVILGVKKCYNVVAADFTGDGLTDVMANRVDATMLLVAPDWKMVEVENTRGIHVYASGAMDVDGDGDLDYVAGRYSPGLLFWLERPAAPTKQPWPFHVIDNQPDGVHGILLRDINGDGRIDMVTNSAHRKGPLPQSILWYQAPRTKNGRWRRNVLGKGDAPGRPHYFASGDFNADGRLDVAVASSGVSLPGGDWLAWWEAPKSRVEPWKKHPIANGQIGATHVLAADVNGDKKLDFIASMGHGRGVYWFQGADWQRHAIDTELRDTHCLVAVDLDGDRDVDVATVSRKDFVAAWFENDGKGRFTRHVVSDKQSAYDMQAADMDRDGDLDLVVAGAESDNVVWLENPSR